ncbi:MAG TPA: hypothetical protein VF121_06765 [Thermoanaerobaculia bacterium]|nr:hypothetical protein [Thermoanaerobaculia bacterium]
MLILLAVVGLGFASVASGSGTGGVAVFAKDDDGGGDEEGGGGEEEGNPLHPTRTEVSCQVAQLVLGEATTCTAVVRDTALNPFDLAGTVDFFGSNRLDAFRPASCDLQKVAGEFRCSIQYEPATVGSRLVNAAFRGSVDHHTSASTNGFEVTVVAPPEPPDDDGGGDGDGGGGGQPPAPPAPPTPPGPDPNLRFAAPPPPSSPPPTLVAPSTTLKQRSKAGSKGKATFLFATDQPGSAFECKLDRGPYKPCASPFAKSVKRGRHTLRVRAVNSAGMADPTPAAMSWKAA